jgi:hypothetical protein
MKRFRDTTGHAEYCWMPTENVECILSLVFDLHEPETDCNYPGGIVNIEARVAYVMVNGERKDFPEAVAMFMACLSLDADFRDEVTSFCGADYQARCEAAQEAHWDAKFEQARVGE